MKTAMQELIDEIVEHLTYDDSLSEHSRVTYETIRLRCIGKLEKEKEQIINDFDNGIYVGTYAVDKDGENYYNQTYNQNK